MGVAPFPYPCDLLKKGNLKETGLKRDRFPWNFDY